MENQFIVLCRNTGDKMIKMEMQKRNQDQKASKGKSYFSSFFSSSDSSAPVVLSEDEQHAIEQEIAAVELHSIGVLNSAEPDAEKWVLSMGIFLPACSLQLKDSESTLCECNLKGEFQSDW